MPKGIIGKNSSIGEIVRKNEDDYINGNTVISKYVEYSMHNTLEIIDAYLNSKHISGEKDSQGRDKPFFNIVIAVANIWYRATDIDRSSINVTATKNKDAIDAMLATIHLQNWMKKARFGAFLNDWGRILSRYGSAVIEFTENSKGLIISALPWNTLIVDPVEFNNNVVIKLLELTEAQLRQNPLYDQSVVEAMITAASTRKTLDKQTKDNKSGYYKLYEVHGNLPLSLLTDDPSDKDIYQEQMQVISFAGGKKGKNDDYDDYTLYRGKKKKKTHMITHLIREDGRTLSIGAVESLLTPQWMMNHSAKAVKDHLDMASKLFFQTADENYLGRNAISSIQNGDILVHADNKPLTQVNNTSHDLTSWQNYAIQWKSLANEITGVSEAMLGAAPKSGTAWRQTEALLQESYNLFELMTENKQLYIEDMLREYIIPYLKKQMDTTDEVVATLDDYDINRIDAKYIKNKAIADTNDALIDMVLKDQVPTPEMQAQMTQENMNGIQAGLQELGSKRFFKPSELDNKSWREQFKDLEWELDYNAGGEAKNIQEALATLNTALNVMMNPAYETNPKAQLVVNKILNLTGVISPIEMQAVPPTPQPIQPVSPIDGSNTGTGTINS